MESSRTLVLRDDSTSSSALSPTMLKLLIALLAIVLVGTTCAGAFLTIRYYRKKRQQTPTLPFHNSPTVSQRSHRRLTITAAPYGRKPKGHVVDEKQALYDECRSPTGTIPEIRITFPEVEDKSGRRQSGRVVVVRISEQGGVGLEPYEEECLPPYQSSDGERFQSLDLERMGGLKEKELEKQWS